MSTSEGDRRWRALAEKAVGRPLENLASATRDGVPIAPLYPRHRGDGPRPWRSGPSRSGWSVSSRVDHPDAAEANRLALLDLEGGADALTLVTTASPFARGFGLAPEDLGRALDSIELDFIALRIDAGDDVTAVAASLAALIETHRLASAGLRIDLGYDPVGLLARSGAVSEADLTSLVAIARQAGLDGGVLLADGRPYHEAGAGEAQELAAVLATGVAYLRRLEAIGLPLDEARAQLSFLLAVDAEVFPGLAKIRALRRLWSRIEAASGLEPKPIRLQAETSWRMMTRRDPWTNVMRATAATVAAGLGGADAITVLPFTLPLGLPDAAARRLARNVQRVLIDEAHLAMVEDPAAGSGGLEALTDGLCKRAWTLFQAIEAEGGIEASLKSGALPGRIAETAQARTQDQASLRVGIVGTSLFASLDAPVPGVLDIAPRPVATPGAGALPQTRDAAPFEALRDRADTAPTRPSVFLATIGAPAAFGARATYAANVLAAGGLAAITTEEERDLDATVEAFVASGARVVCLCGTDKAYAEHAASYAEALRQAGAVRLLRAGPDGGSEDAALHEGCAALAILAATLDAAIGA